MSDISVVGTDVPNRVFERVGNFCGWIGSLFKHNTKISKIAVDLNPQIWLLGQMGKAVCSCFEDSPVSGVVLPACTLGRDYASRLSSSADSHFFLGWLILNTLPNRMSCSFNHPSFHMVRIVHPTLSIKFCPGDVCRFSHVSVIRLLEVSSVHVWFESNFVNCVCIQKGILTLPSTVSADLPPDFPGLDWTVLWFH